MISETVHFSEQKMSPSIFFFFFEAVVCIFLQVLQYFDNYLILHTEIYNKKLVIWCFSIPKTIKNKGRVLMC